MVGFDDYYDEYSDDLSLSRTSKNRHKTKAKKKKNKKSKKLTAEEEAIAVEDDGDDDWVDDDAWEDDNDKPREKIYFYEHWGQTDEAGRPAMELALKADIKMRYLQNPERAKDGDICASYGIVDSDWEDDETGGRQRIRPARVICKMCGNVEKAKKCGSCKSVDYCGKECQAKDWKHHKMFCGKKAD